MAKYQKVGSGSYGVYKKKDNTAAVIGWCVVGLILLAAIAG